MLAMQLNSDLVIQDVSPGCVSAIGYPPEELIGRNLFEFVYTDRAEDAAAIWEGRSFEGEVVRMRSASNQTVSLLASFYREDEGVLLFGEVVPTGVVRGPDVTIELHKRTFSLAKTIEELQYRNDNLEMANQRMREQSVTDSTTGLYRRNHLDRLLKAEWERAKRRPDELSFLLVGVDGIKPFRELQGPAAAERVVRGVARVLEVRKRSFDILGHFDADTFFLILPSTSFHGAKDFAERLLTMLEGREIRTGGYPFKIYLSIGRSTVNGREFPVKTSDDLIHLANEALFAAQMGGGNRVMAVQTPLATPLRLAT
jgi:diguanylate cyclase (GGDEF)-like protein